MIKRLAVVLLVVALALGGWRLFVSLGHILHSEDPLAKADVIFVLGGTRVERVAEGGDLYREGWAPLVLLSREVSEPAEVRLRASGLHVPTETAMQRGVLQQMGVAPGAIIEVEREQLSTGTEVDELVRLVQDRGWSRLIVVTSKLHTARAGLVMRKRLEPLGKQIIMRASRYDTSDLDRWWRDRATARFVLFESQTFVAYALGVGD